MMVNILGPQEPAVKICFLRMSGTSVMPCSVMSSSKLLDAAVQERVTVGPWERAGAPARDEPPTLRFCWDRGGQDAHGPARQREGGLELLGDIAPIKHDQPREHKCQSGDDQNERMPPDQFVVYQDFGRSRRPSAPGSTASC